MYRHCISEQEGVFVVVVRVGRQIVRFSFIRILIAYTVMDF